MKKYSNFLSKLFFIALISSFCSQLQAQGITDEDITIFNPVQTQVPSLTIAPDARGGGMGDVGAATTPDIYSQHWNPSKYAFAYSNGGLGLSYTPWLRKLVNDMYMLYVAGYYKPGDSDLQAIGASMRYFSMGEITGTHDDGQPSGITLNPYDMAFDVSYSRKLGERFAGGVSLRYIHSDMGYSDDSRRPGHAFGADLSGYYTDYVMVGRNECQVGFGFNISNIGTKISFGEDHSYFIPTNLRLGGSFFFPFDQYNMMSINLDLNKYLVPTPPITKRGEEGGEEAWDKYDNTSSIGGMFTSFADSPDGFKGELQEISVSVGAEYSYNDMFFVRAGYHHESQNQGNRKYFTMGAGFKMSIFQLDAAYLVSTVASNPLDQTLRFSLGFDMAGLRELFRR